jgi:hypothetical protein
MRLRSILVIFRGERPDAFQPPLKIADYAKRVGFGAPRGDRIETSDHLVDMDDLLQTCPMNGWPVPCHPVSIRMRLRYLGGCFGQTHDVGVVVQHAIGPGPDRCFFSQVDPQKQIFDEAAVGNELPIGRRVPKSNAERLLQFIANGRIHQRWAGIARFGFGITPKRHPERYEREACP